MSYILDALKESEKKHQRRKSADLLPEEVVETKPAGRKAIWPYLLAFALFLNAGLLVWWLRPWRHEPAPVKTASLDSQKSTRETVTKTTIPPTEMSVEAVKPQHVETPPPEAPQAGKSASAIEDGSNRQDPSPVPSAGRRGTQGDENPAGRAKPQQTVSPPDMSASRELPTRTDPGQFQSRRARYARNPKVQGSTASAPVPAPAGAPEDALRPDTSREAKPRQSARRIKQEEIARRPDRLPEQSGGLLGSRNLASDLEDLTRAENPSAQRASSGKTQRFSELPANIRGSLPKLSVSMLIYSKNAGDRWININGSKRREGQEISSGLKLEEITPDGAFFSYQGHRFFKGVMGD